MKECYANLGLRHGWEKELLTVINSFLLDPDNKHFFEEDTSIASVEFEEQLELIVSYCGAEIWTDQVRQRTNLTETAPTYPADIKM